MKKQITFLGSIIALLIFSSAGFAQVILSNSFENWSNGKAEGWMGSTTNLNADSIVQITTGTVYGHSAVQLKNAASGHKRFSSDVVSIEKDVEYNFKYYVKGKGDIRIGIFNGDPNSEGSGYAYSDYFSVNDADNWVEVQQSKMANLTSANAQFIFSVRNTAPASGSIQIDSVVVTTSLVEPVSIYEIQFTDSASGNSPLKGSTVLTGGIVTAVKQNPNGGYYLQAGTGAWSGIFVFDPAHFASVEIGDSITLSAMVDEYFNTTQLTQVNGFTLVSSGNLVPAAFVGATSLVGTEPYEGVLVKVVDAEVTAAPNNFKVFPVNDGSGSLLVDTVLYRYTPITGRHYNITGIISYNFGSFRLLPRFLDDIEDLVGIEETAPVSSVLVYPNPSAGEIFVQFESNKQVGGLINLMDVTGRLLSQSTVNVKQGMNQFNFSEMTQGIYLVQVQAGGGSSVSRLVVQ